MGIEEVKKEILGNARKDAKRIMQEAEKEGSDIQAAADKQIASIKDRLSREAESTVQGYRTMALAQASSQVNRSMLSLQKNLVTEAFSQATEQLSELDAKTREQHIKTLVQKGKKILGTDAKVYLCEKDRRYIPKSEPADITGGAILESQDGDVRIDLSYDSLMSSIRQDDMKELSKILFE